MICPLIPSTYLDIGYIFLAVAAKLPVIFNLESRFSRPNCPPEANDMVMTRKDIV